MENTLKIKQCFKCGKIKPYSEFSKAPKKIDGMGSRCKICKNEYMRGWRKKNPGYGIEGNKKWRKEHQEQRTETVRRWRIKNRERLRSYWKKYRSTLNGKLNARMSIAILRALRHNKKGYRWESFTGYTSIDLKEHLESLFVEGMSWDNIGEWHIDHVVPISRFNYDKPEDPEFKVCWGLKNLQPLWAQENRLKHDKTMVEWLQYKQGH